MKLHKAQIDAINHNDGPALIIAPAGTGKTAVITSRINRLISDRKNNVESILALTFTEKAASEMQNRVEESLDSSYIYHDFWISTFHSFCDRILRNHALDIGISDDYKLIEETSSWIFLHKNLKHFNFKYYKQLGNPNKFIRSLIDHFSKCKNQGITPNDYLNFVKKTKIDQEKNWELAFAYQKYQELLLKNNFLDFGDLINYTLFLFKKRPSILKKYKNQFKYILIDEFQDTNISQYDLIKIITNKKENIMICADPNQSIYQWRSASTDNINQFIKDYSKVKKIVLSKNYRSFQNILDLSSNFIDSNTKLIASRKGSGEIDYFHFKTQEHEFNGVIDKIKKIKKRNSSLLFNDFAVLTRTNNDANLFAKAFERSGLPYQFLSQKGLYQKSIIIDIISYFKLLDNYHENSAVYRVLNFSFLNLDFEDIAKITHFSNQYNLKSVYSVLKDINLVPDLKNETILKINNLVFLIKKHSNIAMNKNISEVFIAFLYDSGYLDFLSNKGKKEDLDYLNEFYNRIIKFEESNNDLRLTNFMEEIKLEIESGESGKLRFNFNENDNTIKVMTAHSSKGLEFKYVFITTLVDKKFPTNRKSGGIEIPKGLSKEIISDKEIHQKEERRIFYVAMTRAKDGLFFTSADNYGETFKKPSIFLTQMGFVKNKYKESKINFLNEKKINEKENLPLPKEFSFTQLTAFLTCPLQYKKAHLYKLITKSSSSAVFGKSIHDSICKITLSLIKDDINISSAIDIYHKKWINQWYKSQEERDEYFNLGKKIIKRFYKNFKKENPRILKINNRLAIEYNFKLKFNDFFLKGKIDRIDEVVGGVEIIDYKTGQSKDKLTFQEKSQLFIYQMIISQTLGLNVKKLTFHYLKDDKKVSFLGKNNDINKINKKINNSILKIKEGNFNANPGWHCKWCDFRDICEYKQL